MMEPIILTSESTEHKRKSRGRGGKKKKPQPLIENSPSSDLLEILTGEDDIEKQREALNQLQNFVVEQKPQYRQLEGEIMTHINDYYNNNVRTNLCTLADIVKRFLEIYKECRKNGMDPLICDLFLKINQRIKKSFAESFDEDVKRVGLDFWTNVDGLNLESYLATFEIEGRISAEDIIPNVDARDDKKLIETVHCIRILKLFKHFDIADITRRLIEAKQVPLLTVFLKAVPDNQDLQRHAQVAVNELVAAENLSKASDYVQAFNLDPKLFPELLKNLRKSSLRHSISTETWIKIEEKLSGNEIMLAYYVEELIKNGELDLALSIMERHKINHLLDKDILAQIEPYITVPPLKEFQYIKNPVYIADRFSPTEEIIGEAPKEKYWNLCDFGLETERDVIIIQDSETEVFNEAVKDILTSEEIGLDSEFSLAPSKFDVSKLMLLQLANHKRIYLFDCKSLTNSEKYHKFLKELLANPKIMKIGHSLLIDLKKIYEECAGNEDLVVMNHMDVSKLFIQLHPDTRYSSLAYICETILKKPMSKFEQNSNWERRPLRKAQVHYAAFDAFVLLKIYDILKDMSKVEVRKIEEINEGLNEDKSQGQTIIENCLKEESVKHVTALGHAATPEKTTVSSQESSETQGDGLIKSLLKEEEEDIIK